MARRLAAALTLALLAAAPWASPARAQTLQRLTVESFTLSADTSKPEIEVPFHLVVSLTVKERVAGIDNLELPILAELELLGDERRTVARSSGTQYRETITVVAHHTGAVTIAPATLQAIDARDGRPKQYFTNALTLQVTGGKLEPFEEGQSLAAAAAALAIRVALWTLGILCAIAVLVLALRRRRAPPPAPAPPAPVAPAVPLPSHRSRREELGDALSVLRADPVRPTAVAVRAAVWRMVGGTDGETLADVLQRSGASDPRIRDVLRALERAAFTYDADLQAAIAGACTALERYLA